MAKKRVMAFRGKVHKIAEKRERGGSSYGYLRLPTNVQMFQPAVDTKVTMDMLPYLVTSESHPDKTLGAEKGVYWLMRPFKVHKDVGVQDERVVCLSSVGKKCPICEYRAKLIKKNGDPEEIKSLRPSERILLPVIIRRIDEDVKREKTVQVMDQSHFLFSKEFEQQLGDDERFDTYALPEQGCSVRVIFGAGQFGGGKPFPKPTRFDFVERKTQYNESILDNVPKLDELLIIYTYNELKEKFFELDSSYDADDNDDDWNDDNEETTDEWEDENDDENDDWDDGDDDEDGDDDDWDDGDDDDEDEDDWDDENDDVDEDEDDDWDDEDDEPARTPVKRKPKSKPVQRARKNKNK